MKAKPLLLALTVAGISVLPSCVYPSGTYSRGPVHQPDYESQRVRIDHRSPSVIVDRTPGRQPSVVAQVPSQRIVEETKKVWVKPQRANTTIIVKEERPVIKVRQPHHYRGHQPVYLTKLPGRYTTFRRNGRDYYRCQGKTYYRHTKGFTLALNL